MGLHLYLHNRGLPKLDHRALSSARLPDQSSFEASAAIDPFSVLAQLVLNTVRVVKARHDGAAASAAKVDPLGDLARRAAARNRKAMLQLVVAVGPAMLRAIRKVLGHATADTEDVLQEAVEGFLRAIETFKGQCTVLHFACRVAVLSALSSRRRTAFRESLTWDTPDGEAEAPSAEPSPAEAATRNRRREVLALLLDELSPAQAEVLVLHCALGFTVEEIARSANCPLETIRSRLRLAKQSMRDRISGSSQLAEILELDQ
jgi:RNA polymerase sigma factor (sigma-70 family)